MMFVWRIWYWSNYWDCCFPRTQISTNSEGRKLWPSTQCIGKEIWANSQLITHANQRAAKVISEAFFTRMTGDHHSELAVMDLSMITVTLTPSWFVWIFNSCVSLVIFFIITVLLFVLKHKTIFTRGVLAVFDFCRHRYTYNLTKRQNL